VNGWPEGLRLGEKFLPELRIIIPVIAQTNIHIEQRAQFKGQIRPLSTHCRKVFMRSFRGLSRTHYLAGTLAQTIVGSEQFVEPGSCPVALCDTDDD
jgi:hypothetical protein